MMKNVLVILTFLLSVVLTGCGSNSKPDGGSNPALDKVLELQGQEILQAPNGTDFSLTMPFRKLIDEAYLVELSGFSLEVTGECTINAIGYTPTTLKFEGLKDSLEALYVTGTFDANCTPTGYLLTATQKITSGSQSDTRQVSFAFDYSGSITPQHDDGYSFYNATTPLTVSEANTKYQIKVQLLKDGYVAVGETIKLRPFDNTYGNTAVYEATTGPDGYATFEYTSPETLPAYGSSVTLTADYFLEDNTTITPKEVVLSFTASPGAEVDTTGMELVAVPNSVNISEAGESRALSLYLANTSTHDPVADKDIRALWFDPNNGKLNSYIATTDSNGQAVFNYTAPETLPSGNLTITFEVVNGTPGLQRDVTVNFTSTSTPTVDTTNYSMYAVPGSINISEDGESKVVSLFLEDTSTNQPVEGQEIIAHFFNPNSGTLSAYSASTNSNGQVAFEYTAPASIAGAADFDITFSIPNATNSHDTNVAVNFTSTSTPTVDTTTYNLTAVPASVNISEGGENRALSLFLEDTSTNQPVEGQEIIAHFFNPNSGTLSAYSAITNSNGQVVFNYTAPESISGLSDFDITFSIPNATNSHDTNVAVNFTSTSTPTVDTTTYNLTAVPASVNISEGGENRALSLFLNDTGTSQPVEGQEIIAHFFNPNSGTLSAYSAITNSNGQVVFNYTAPASIAGVADFNITFAIPNATDSHETNVAIGFGSNVADYNLTAEDNITITGTSESYQISVALSKKEGANPWQPAVGSSVIAEFVMPMYGTITQYEVIVNESGMATFEFISPDDISGLNDTNITFYYKNDMTVMDRTLVTYNAQTVEGVDTMYVVPGSFTVTEQDETREITIVTVNSENVGISTTVQLEQPFFNNTNYGSFDTTQVTTDASGKATVTYTAPASLTGLTERNITVTETTESITKELNIKFGTPETVGTNYEITVDVPEYITVENTDQISVKIHELGNPGNVIPDAYVNEVNLTSIFTNILTFSNGNQNATYAGLGTNAIEVETKTLSGVAIIEVTADVYNGDHNVTLSASVPVTVLSGEVTAMSIFYVSSSETPSGEFVNTYTIHAVDKYGNPAREGVTIHPSLINGTKVDPITSIYTEQGEIIQGDPSLDSFEDATADFVSDGVTVLDRLVIVPNPSKYDSAYLGNWTLDSVLSGTELALTEEYYGTDESNLSYVIGNENRYIAGYGVAVADIVTKAGGYITDENGNVQFDVKFDPILAGHTATIAANAYDGERTGVAKIAGLRWGHYYSSSELLRIDGSDHNVTLSVGISNSADAPLEPLVGLKLSHTGIVSSSAQCEINSAATGDIITDHNGEFTVVISTYVTLGDDTECTIEWSKSNASIYREY